MSSLSIRNMNWYMSVMEQVREDAEKNLPVESEAIFDWRVYRKAKRGNNDVTICILHQYTKREFANWWIKFARPGYKAKVWVNWQKIRSSKLVVKGAGEVL